jgi:hypothetical protein
MIPVTACSGSSSASLLILSKFIYSSLMMMVSAALSVDNSAGFSNDAGFGAIPTGG